MKFECFNLEDVISLVIDNRGITPTKKGGSWSHAGHRVLSAKNIKTGHIINEDSIRYIDEDLYEKWMPCDVQKYDIIMTSEAPCGQVFLWDSDEKVVLGQRLFGLRCKPFFDPRYVYFYMCGSAFQGELSNRNSGTTVQGIRQKELMRCSILAPPLEVQKKIADILHSIERMIISISRINDNLERQCQEILSHYYEIYDSRSSNIGELAEVIDCLHSKKPVLKDSGKRFIQLDNIRDNGLLDFSIPFWISEGDYSHWISRCEVQEGDIVITNVGRIGAVSQMPIGEKAAMGRNMTCIRPKKYPYFLIVSLLSPSLRSEIDYNTDSGTIMNALNVRNIPKLAVRIFDEPIQMELEKKF